MTVRSGGPAQDVYIVGADPSGGGEPTTISAPLGRQADAASVSTALSTEDVALLTALLTITDFDTKIGSLTETAPATDTASSGLNGRLQRIAQRLTSLIALLPAALGAGGGIKIDGSGTALPVSESGTWTVQPGNTANTTPWLVSLQPATSGGSSIYRNLDTGSTGAVAKNGAGQLYGYYIYNNATSARFLKIYDKATAPTSGDTPVMTYPIPAGSAANVAFPNGVAFANGISVRATTGVADADTGAPSTNDVIVNVNYK